MYFCGQPEAGKTTLARALANISIKLPDEINSLKMRTRGIDVMQVKLANGTEYSFWDFAGQPDYHVHHDLFMFPESAVFMVLVDARKSSADQLQHATYWLQYIVTQCRQGVKPSILLVATHADEVKAEDYPEYGLDVHLALLYDQLHDVFGEVATFIREGFISVNCREASGPAMGDIHAELQKATERFKAENASPTPAICKQMIDVIGQLRISRTRFLMWDQFVRAMDEVSRDRGLLKIATRHLHRIGDVYYGEKGPLSELVIIDLPWLCHEVLGWVFCPPDMLKAHEMVRLMRFRQLAEAGAVKQKDIPITHAFEGTQIKTLDVLEAFDLCYGFQQDSEQMYVFPSLLRAEASAVAWCESKAFDAHMGLMLTCSSVTTMIPPGFFERVQVRVRLEIGPPFTAALTAVRSPLIWHNGAICHDNNTQCLLCVSRDGRSIRIHVRGSAEGRKEMRGMLHRVVQVIQDVSKFSEGLELAIHHLSSIELGKYARELPYSFDQSAIIDARLRERKRVMTSDGHVELLQDLLAFDSEGWRKYI